MISSSMNKSFLVLILQLIHNIIIIFINICLMQQLLNMLTVSPFFLFSYLLHSFRFQSCILLFLPCFYFYILLLAYIPVLLLTSLRFTWSACNVWIYTIFSQSVIIIFRTSNFIKSTALIAAFIAYLRCFWSRSRSLF